jgi:hypothetical protein
LRVPELVFANLDPVLSRTEPDPEIQDLLRASAGRNLALDYLPGSITFDPLVEKIDPKLASQIVWFDAFVTNVDRTPRNPNLLVWHKNVWLIDHGASLYFHHAWKNWEEQSRGPFAQIKDHILLNQASKLNEVDPEFRQLLTYQTLESIVSLVPADWLALKSVNEQRKVYYDYLQARLGAADIFVKEAEHARERVI